MLLLQAEAMSEPEVKPPWRRKKRWLAVAAMWLIASVSLGAGPTHFALHRGWLREAALAWRRTVTLDLNQTPLKVPYCQYAVWWWSKATGEEYSVTRDWSDDPVFHIKSDPTSPRSATTATWPPGSVYFGAFVSKFENTRESRTGSASSQTGSSGNDTVHVCPSASNRGRTVSAARRMISDTSTDRRFRSTRPPQNPADVEQVVHQPHPMFDLPGYLVRDIELSPRHSKQVDTALDRGERVPQLVPEHRQRLIFAAVGVQKRLLGPPAVSHVDADGDGEVPVVIQRRLERSVCGASSSRTPLLSLNCGRESISRLMPSVVDRHDDLFAVGVTDVDHLIIHSRSHNDGLHPVDHARLECQSAHR